MPSLARPWPIVDHDGCALRSSDLFAEKPRQNVGGTARCGGNDKLDRSLCLRGRPMPCKGKVNASEGGGARG